MGDVTLAGRPYYVVRVTDVLLDRWSVEFEGIGPEGLLIVVSRPFDAPASALEVTATGELTEELRGAAIAHAQDWLSDDE
ncbi:hypothetical protein [Streptomyces sp. NPDC002133]|uniref:hypothetical protein n=1 Tax=Streptomyces sp. NPDC002133 TaxID=3154409 RepID=UPI00333067F1